jgi:hypothetical protein
MNRKRKNKIKKIKKGKEIGKEEKENRNNVMKEITWERKEGKIKREGKKYE